MLVPADGNSDLGLRSSRSRIRHLEVDDVIARARRRPVIAPVEEFSVVPSGKVIGVSVVTLQVYDPVPPVAVRVVEYDSYWVPPGKVAGLVMEGGLVAPAARGNQHTEKHTPHNAFLRTR